METMKGNLIDFRAFCAVVEYGGLTRAAQQIGESKGCISRRITRLENQLGLKLLTRSSRFVCPTEGGMKFYQYSLQALALLDEGFLKLQNISQKPVGRLRVNLPIGLGSSIFATLIAEFLDLYPQTQIEVVYNDAAIDLRTDEIEIGLEVRNSLPTATYVFHSLTSIPIQLFASPHYLERHGTPREPTELIDRAILLHQKFVEVTHLTFERSSRQCSLKLNPCAISNDFAYLQQMASLGVGIALLPNFLGTTDILDDRLVPVLPEWLVRESLTLYLLYERDRRLPDRLTSLRDFICDRFRSPINPL
jgi:DNA-binding transcriptional LysR family regulator